MTLRLANNADGILALIVLAEDTSLTLQAGHGASFPELSGDDYFPITAIRAENPAQLEIMHCTGRSGDTLTVERAQEGSVALSFSPGDVISHRLTAGTLENNFPQMESGGAKSLRFSVSDDNTGLPELTIHSNSGSAEQMPRRLLPDPIPAKSFPVGRGDGSGYYAADDTQALNALGIPAGKPTTDPAVPVSGSLLSGAMLAAGAIVEMGENANGQYWRWESGLQFATARLELSLNTLSFQPASYAAEFYSGVSLVGLSFSLSATSGTSSVWWSGAASVTVHGADGSPPNLLYRGGLSETRGIVEVLAIGRWK